MARSSTAAFHHREFSSASPFAYRAPHRGTRSILRTKTCENYQNASKNRRIIVKISHLTFVMKLSISILPSPAPSRSCARCGSGFRASAREYICPDCRTRKRQDPKQGSDRLSFREQQIVALVRQAKANKEIAYELCLTEGTVKEYLYHIFRKLNVSSRTELALRAYRETLILQTPLQSHSPQYVYGEKVSGL